MQLPVFVQVHRSPYVCRPLYVHVHTCTNAPEDSDLFYDGSAHICMGPRRVGDQGSGGRVITPYHPLVTQDRHSQE